jgi:hypothetical protein
MAGDGGRAPDVSEQRAEVEAVARALAGDDSGPWYAYEEDAERAVAALDAARARDPASVLAALLAEQPDATIAALEALLTSDRRKVTMHPAFGSPDPWVCMTCGGSRSPQGEDHEAARRAAHEAAQDYVDAAGGDEVDTGHVVDEALAAYLSRVAAPPPARDARDDTTTDEAAER